MVLFNLKHLVAPTVSGNISNPLLKNIVKDEIVAAGAAGGLAIGHTVIVLLVLAMVGY